MINGFHAFWSLGAVVGSLMAGVAAYFAIAPVAHFAAVAAVVAVASAWFLRDLPDTRSGAARVAPPGAGRLVADRSGRGRRCGLLGRLSRRGRDR